MKKIIVTAIAFVSINSAHAEWTNVYCAKPDGSHWDWLEDDDDDNQVTISGQWGSATLSNGSSFEYFSVSESDYLPANIQCKSKFSSDHVAQPADNSSSYWALFQVNNVAGEQYFAAGRLVNSRLNRSCSPLSTVCPLIPSN